MTLLATDLNVALDSQATQGSKQASELQGLLEERSALRVEVEALRGRVETWKSQLREMEEEREKEGVEWSNDEKRHAVEV